MCFVKETLLGHPKVNDDDIKTHKEFLIQFIDSLICCAKNEDTEHSITRQSTPVGQFEPVIHHNKTAQVHFSRTHPSHSTFDYVRFLPGAYDLIPRKQRKYKYYQYLVAVATVKKEPPPKE